MLAVLIISISILGTFIIRQRRTKKTTGHVDGVNYTLGSNFGSGVTDQLVMTQSPSSHDSNGTQLSRDSNEPQFVYIDPKELDYRCHLQKHINIISNRRVSQILSGHHNFSPDHRGPPPTYEESHRIYATISPQPEPSGSICRQPRRVNLNEPIWALISLSVNSYCEKIL